MATIEVKDPISAALDIGGKLIDRLWPSEAERADARLKLLAMQQSGELAQIAVNTEEAKNPSVFASGWRPFIGWVCGAACAWNWLGLPVTKVALAYFGHPLEVSPADLGEMMPVLLGMLGLGGLRTLEKLNGKAAV